MEELNPERSLSHSPLFQVMFILAEHARRSAGAAGSRGAGAACGRGRGCSEGAPDGTARFDLTLSVQETPAGLVGGLEYNTDLFERGTIRRMLGHYARLLEAIAAAPRGAAVAAADAGRARSSSSSCSSGTRRRVRIRTTRAFTSCSRRRRARRPDAVALVHEGSELTYGELNRRANQLAHRLIERGVGPEVRVALCMPRSPEMVIGDARDPEGGRRLRAAGSGLSAQAPATICSRMRRSTWS